MDNNEVQGTSTSASFALLGFSQVSKVIYENGFLFN